MKVFISHSCKDNEIAKIVVEVLTKYNITHFVDFKQLEVGDKMTTKLNNELRSSSIFLLIWTQNAQTSTWVVYEKDAAMEYPSMKKVACKLDDIPLEMPYASFVRPEVNRENLNSTIESLVLDRIVHMVIWGVSSLDTIKNQMKVDLIELLFVLNWIRIVNNLNHDEPMPLNYLLRITFTKTDYIQI